MSTSPQMAHNASQLYNQTMSEKGYFRDYYHKRCNEKQYCRLCDKNITYSHKSYHCHSQKHIRNVISELKDTCPKNIPCSILSQYVTQIDLKDHHTEHSDMQTTNENRSIELNGSDTTVPTESDQTKLYHCEVCKMDFPCRIKNSHGQTLKHKLQLQRFKMDVEKKNKQSVNPSTTANGKYYCEICKISMCAQGKNRHNTTQKHIINEHYSKNNLNSPPQDDSPPRNVSPMESPPSPSHGYESPTHGCEPPTFRESSPPPSHIDSLYTKVQIKSQRSKYHSACESTKEYFDDYKKGKLQMIIQDVEKFYVCYTCGVSNSMNHLDHHVSSQLHQKKNENDVNVNLVQDLK